MVLSEHLPKGLVKWCAIRLATHAFATTKVDMPDLTCLNAIKAWERR